MTADKMDCASAASDISDSCVSASLLAEMQRLIDAPSQGDDKEVLQSWQDWLSELASAEDSADTQREGSDTNGGGRRRPALPPRIGRFELRSILGSGGFGIVFRAHDPQLDRDVALKILRPEAALSPRVQRRFLREATAAAQLEHVGIISVYDAGEHAGLSYLAAPLCEGPNLADWMREHWQELSPRQVAALVAQVAEAVQHAHARGILHRDLKPSNILLKTGSLDDLGFQPLLTDFGLAGRLDGEGDETIQGMILGTTAYMSPEQAAGRSKEVGVASDVFSLGVILYELLTGVRPFTGESPEEIRQNIGCLEPAAPRRIRRTIPLDLETICLKCLAKDPRDRYLSAGELAADLRRFLQHEPIVARPTGFATQVRLWCRRRPLVAGLVVLLATTLVGSAAVTAVLYQRERGARAQAEEHLDVARQAVSNMYTKVADRWLIDQPEVQGLRREFLEDALQFYERIAAERPRDERSRHELSVALHRMANMTANLGRQTESFEYRRRCLEIVDALRREFPNNETYQYDGFMNRLLFAGNYPGRTAADRIAILLEADAILRRLVDRHPDNPVYRDALAALCVDLAYHYFEDGSLDEARRLWREGAELATALTQQFPNRPLYAKHAATANMQLAVRSVEAGRRDEAEAYFSKAKYFLDEIRRQFPNTRWVDDLAFTVLATYAYALCHLGDLQPTVPLLEDCRECMTRLVAWYPKTPGYRAHRAVVCAWLARGYSECGRSADRQAVLEEAESDVQRVLAQIPDESTALAAFRLIQESRDPAPTASTEVSP